MNATMPTSSRAPGAPPAGCRWSGRARAAASLLVVLHLVAVLVGPMSVSRSVLAGAWGTFFVPYLQAAYLDHGYKFFAPDPGPSHLVRYELEFADGRRRAGLFPNRQTQWPRLLYHRHFMLSEFVNSLPRDPEWDPRLSWERQPLSAAEKAYVRSYAAHLLKEHGARRVTLELVEHAIPFPQDVLDGMPLDHPSLYRTRPLGSYEGEQP